MNKRNAFLNSNPRSRFAKPSWDGCSRSAFIVLVLLLGSLGMFPSQTLALPNTDTPTDTPSDTPTITPTDSPTNTPTNTPTVTITPTITQTPTPQPAQGPVPLGSAASYAVLAGTTVTNTGSTTLCGDLGLSPGTSVTGGPVLSCGGIMHITDSAAAAAQVDLIAAYNNAAGRLGVTQLPQLGGITLFAGVYNSATGFLISTGDLTLDAQGNPNAVFIFQAGTGLTVATSRKVILIGGAQASNVFWQIGSSATINAGADFKGTILALTDINFFTGATFAGQALARNGQVVLQGQSGGLGAPVFTSTGSGSLAGQLVLAPVPAHRGDRVILFFDKPPTATQWEIVNVAGESVATLSFTGTSNHYWDSTGVAPGIYFVRIKINYLDGTNIQITRKAVVIP